MRAAVALLVVFSVRCHAGPPTLTNAQLQTHAFSGNLESQIRADHSTWFGYEVEATPAQNDGCQWGTFLERHEGNGGYSVTSSSPVLLEGSKTVAILVRISNNAVDKIQVYPTSCSLDAGGLPFVWITGVPQEASLTFLRKLVDEAPSRHNLDGALFAISRHAGKKSEELLIEMARQNSSPHVRAQALFWLAQRASERAVSTITNAVINDPDTEVKKRAVFALSQLPGGEGVSKLIDVARAQRNPEVTKQAFFWLGQSHDPRALAFIEQVLLRQ